MKFTVKSDNKRFQIFLKRFIKESEKEAGAGLNDIAFTLMKRVVARWPVDKRIGRGGRSRAAWLVSLEKLSGNKNIMPSVRGGGTNPKEVAQGRKLGFLKRKIKNTKNPYIEIINMVHYALKLEYGYSSQAPYGVVRREMRKLSGNVMPEKLGNRLVRKWNRGW